MTSLARSLFGLLMVFGFSAALSCALAGCKEEEPPPPPPPPPPPAPTTVDPSAVAEFLTLDSRVNLSNAPAMECSEEEVRAILEFVSAFATGNADALRPKLDSASRRTLDKLIETGQWQEETAKIIEVDLIDRKPMPMGNVVTFNVILPRVGRVQQDWLVTQRGDMFTFAAFAIPPVSKQQQQLEEAIKAATDAMQQGEGQTPQDPGRRIPQPSDPSPPPGKGPTQP